MKYKILFIAFLCLISNTSVAVTNIVLQPIVNNIDYKIEGTDIDYYISDNSERLLNDFTKKINQDIKNGYILQGGISCSKVGCFQAMCKY